MNASVKGCLLNFNKAWKMFDYKGRPMRKEEVKAVLEWADNQGIKSTGDIPDDKIALIIDYLNAETS